MFAGMAAALTVPDEPGTEAAPRAVGQGAVAPARAGTTMSDARRSPRVRALVSVLWSALLGALITAVLGGIVPSRSRRARTSPRAPSLTSRSRWRCSSCSRRFRCWSARSSSSAGCLATRMPRSPRDWTDRHRRSGSWPKRALSGPDPLQARRLGTWEPDRPCGRATGQRQPRKEGLAGAPWHSPSRSSRGKCRWNQFGPRKARLSQEARKSRRSAYSQTISDCVPRGH